MNCLLADHQIASLVKNKKLIIKPFSAKCLEPASYDLRVGKSIISITGGGEKALNEDGKFVINPGELILIESMEKVGFPDFLQGRICSKVTLLQKGLSSIATKIDPGYGIPKGWPLLLVFHHYGHEVIELSPGQPVCSVEIESLDAPAKKTYTPKGPMRVAYSENPDPLLERELDFRKVRKEEVERFHGHPIDDLVLAIGELQKSIGVLKQRLQRRPLWKTGLIIYLLYFILITLLSFHLYVLIPMLLQSAILYTMYFGIAGVIGVLLGLYKWSRKENREVYN